jgi:GT2 family glycosyltransferase
MNKIGIGIITCNRPDYLKGLLATIPKELFDNVVIINDGDSLTDTTNIDVIPTKGKQGVAVAKNLALKTLLHKKAEHIFLIEDDMLIKDPTVFEQYIEASQLSGIEHFNYGPGSPFNRKQVIQNFDLHNRHLLDQDTEPNPKLVLDYDLCKVALYEHTVAMFSYFTKEVLEKVGLIDEKFYNAWEHVDHTYRIIKAGYHPPFWWFADLANSHELITEAPNAIDNSSIAKDTKQWNDNVMKGRELYFKKHGHYPNQPPYISKEEVISIIKQLKP